ncbi:MAG: imidazole glycerol phosphate synthase subunit HisH [Vicinamibacterales bacterium]
MIALVDYKAGNLTSVRKALTALGASFFTPATAAELEGVTGVIVPGVGHFTSTANLDEPWRRAIEGRVLAGAPLLGICVGMQWLFEGSAESPECPGLGVLPGRCERLAGNAAVGVKVPHVGWNALVPPPGTRSVLLQGVAPGSQVYFTHSYAPPVTNDCVAATTHGAETFGAAVERGHVFGVQFHPEKSSDVGLRILGNFLEACQ